MDTLKGQDNGILKKLSSENRYEILIVLNYLVNKCHPLDLPVNKRMKTFI